MFEVKTNTPKSGGGGGLIALYKTAPPLLPQARITTRRTIVKTTPQVRALRYFYALTQAGAASRS
jgi:hypothetical protein